MWSKYVSNKASGLLRLPVLVFARVARKSSSDKFTAKTDFPIGHFMSLLLTLEV